MKIASIRYDRHTHRWEAWYQSECVKHSVYLHRLQTWAKEHGYETVGPRADDVDFAETDPQRIPV